MSPLAINFPYQDPSLDIEQRIDDLLARMTIDDKAGLMFQPMAAFGDFNEPGMFGMPPLRTFFDRRINHFNILTAPSAREVAQWHNAVQEEALRQPLGIPITVSTDPRHSFTDNPATALFAGPFSQWPEAMGFAAIGDAELVRRYIATVRREYIAVGIRLALHPQIDLATEPRWARQMATFGTDADLTAELGVAYVQGLQGERIGATSVSAMAKHFPGGGPQKDGEDPHFAYGREQVYPGGRFELHLAPFEAVIKAGVSQIMPYYGMPVGLTLDGEPVEEVGFSFNRQIITGVLRERLGFDGIVCSDWAILFDKAWGVEHLSYEERMLKALDAGIDQFGGEFRPGVLAGLVAAGRVSEDRVNTSARRLLREKFRLGLFDDRFVDVAAADAIVGAPEAREEGIEAQAMAYTVLRNADQGQAALPLRTGVRVFIDQGDDTPFRERATVVSDPADADVIVVRLAAPWEERADAPYFHAGSLEFAPEVVARVEELARHAPVIVDIYLERPAIVAPLLGAASSLIANFGAGPEALARVLFGQTAPRGRLPFEIPSSTAAVEAAQSDVPNDTVSPTFPAGFGLALG